MDLFAKDASMGVKHLLLTRENAGLHLGLQTIVVMNLGLRFGLQTTVGLGLRQGFSLQTIVVLMNEKRQTTNKRT